MGHTDQVTVRDARLEDVDTLVQFSAAMALETENRKLDPKLLRRGTVAVIESASKGFYLVAEASNGDDRAVIGQLLITYEWSDWRNATFWWIQSVYVQESWRGRGVYRQMHESVITRAKASPDVCGLRLYVEGANVAAQEVYRRVGLLPSTYRVFERDFVLPRDGDSKDPAGERTTG